MDTKLSRGVLSIIRYVECVLLKLSLKVIEGTVKIMSPRAAHAIELSYAENDVTVYHFPDL